MDATFLHDLYTKHTGKQPIEIVELPSSGSNRRYFRLKGEPTLIGVLGTCRPENDTFLYLADHFKQKGLPVPEVVAVSDDHMAYLQTDLGDTILFNAIEKGRKTSSFSTEEKELLIKTIRLLPDVQFAGAVGLDFNKCYPASQFDVRSIMWDLNYFKYCFLKTSGIDFNENDLEDDFERLADTLLREPTDTFMYRDFQSRNVMICDGKPYFIDFQGGRKGPIYYDVASLLWQAKANIPADLRNHLIDCYLKSASAYTRIDADAFRLRLRHFVLFRQLQVLGAYGFRGRFEGKAHFIESIPLALAKLAEHLSTPFDEYPTLNSLLLRLIEQSTKNNQKRQSLLVSVGSFSYKRGLPKDPTGNGGGFIFDCRAMHNPGRYEEYKSLTGRDAPVIEFLEQRGEVGPFLQSCQALVDKSIEVYLRRGFTNLSVYFGCTGGQHRSVYCAEHLAQYINQKYDVDVRLEHREQNIVELLAGSQTNLNK